MVLHTPLESDAESIYVIKSIQNGVFCVSNTSKRRPFGLVITAVHTIHRGCPTSSPVSTEMGIHRLGIHSTRAIHHSVNGRTDNGNGDGAWKEMTSSAATTAWPLLTGFSAWMKSKIHYNSFPVHREAANLLQTCYVVSVVHRFGVGFVIERSLVRLPSLRQP